MDWVETILYKAELTSEWWNINLDNYEITTTELNSLSNNLKINDIIESSIINIWGSTYNWNITWTWINFNFQKELLEWIKTEVIISATLKQNENIENNDSLSLSDNMNVILWELFSWWNNIKNYSKTILYKKPEINFSVTESIVDWNWKLKITTDKQWNNNISTKINKLYFIESWNTEDSYKLYKEWDSWNFIESTNEWNKRIFDLSNFVYNTFSDEINYIITPKWEQDKTYTISSDLRIAEYEIIEDNWELIYSNEKNLNKALDFWTKTY